ncbi:MAG: hydrogenase iron-sulfur subunit [Anaerolineales bacterium]
MADTALARKPKILVLATFSGGYAGANTTGQAHAEYPANTYVLPVVCPVLFPPKFYLRAFEQGIDGIIMMYSGTDSPFSVEADGTAKLIGEAYTLMKERGLDIRRLRLAAICTVCVKPFLKEINQMNDLLKEIGFAKAEMTKAKPVAVAAVAA